MAGSGIQSPSSLLKQMSRSSEAASCEISQLGASSDVFGETRDFGPHLGRSSSEVHRQLTSTNSAGSGRVSVSSPGVIGTGETISTISGGRSESTSEGALSTPTQGFAPVHFTDRSPPNNVIAHPTPVSGQRASASSTGGEPSPADPSSSPSTSLSSTLPPPPSAHTAQPTQQLILSPSSLSELANIQTRGPLSSSPGSALAQTGGSGSKPPAADSLSAQAPSSAGGSTSSDSAQHQTPRGDHTLASLEGSSNIQDASGTKEGLMSSFSPSQQISNFFQFTSSFIRNAAGSQPSDKKSPTGAVSSPTVKVTPPGQALRLKSGCTREEMERVLGPSPDGEYTPRVRSQHTCKAKW